MNGYVAGGYAAAVFVLAAYSWRTVRRGKELAKTLPPEERTWR